MLRGSSGKDVLGVLVEQAGDQEARHERGRPRSLVSGGGRADHGRHGGLPPGQARVELAGASSPGVADIVLGADGTQLAASGWSSCPSAARSSSCPSGGGAGQRSAGARRWSAPS
ncbi:MAG: hypothetical protein R2734_05300 [Nocardioides sp.]